MAISFNRRRRFSIHPTQSPPQKMEINFNNLRRQLAQSFNQIATGAVEKWDTLSSAEKLNWCEHRQNLGILLCIYQDGAENFDELDPDLLIEFPEEDFI